MQAFPLPAAHGLTARHTDLLDIGFLSALDSRVTLTRSGTGATYFNASGVLTAAGANVARFDHNPATNAALGLLIEESRKNWITNSADIGTGNSVISAAMTVATSATLSPDGVAFYQSLTGTNATAQHYQAKSSTGILPNVLSTFSFWIIPNGKRYVQVFLDDTSAANGAYCNIDTTSMTVVAGPTALGTGAGIACTVTPGPGTAMRVALTCNPTQTGTASRGGILQIDTSGAGFAATSAGNGVSGYLVWGCQFEPGAFATSYIPTAGSAVTRNADVATITLAVNGTVAVNFIQNGNNGAAAFPRLFGDAGASNHGMYLSPTQQLGVYDGGSVNATANSATLGVLAKGCVTMPAGAGTGNAVLNAGSLATVALSTGFPSTSWQFMSDNSGIDVCNGTIQRFRHWPRVLDVQEMQAATT